MTDSCRACGEFLKQPEKVKEIQATWISTIDPEYCHHRMIPVSEAMQSVFQNGNDGFQFQNEFEVVLCTCCGDSLKMLYAFKGILVHCDLNIPLTTAINNMNKLLQSQNQNHKYSISSSSSKGTQTEMDFIDGESESLSVSVMDMDIKIESVSQEIEIKDPLAFLPSLVESEKPTKITSKNNFSSQKSPIVLDGKIKNQVNIFETSAHVYVDSSISVRFTCDFPSCGKTYSRLYDLKIHKQVHGTGDDEKPIQPHPGFRCTWKGCSKNFKQRRNLTRHLKEHTITERFFCKNCTRSYLRAENLAKHRKKCKP